MQKILPWLVAALGGATLYRVLVAIHRILRPAGEWRMRISDLIHQGMMVPDLGETTPRAVLGEIAGLVSGRHRRINEDELFRVLHECEQRGPLPIDQGVAVLRGEVTAIGHFIACLGRSQVGVDLGSPTTSRTHLIFVLAVPRGNSETLANALSQLARLFQHSSLQSMLMAAKTAAEMHQIMSAVEDRLGDRPPA